MRRILVLGLRWLLLRLLVMLLLVLRAESSGRGCRRHREVLVQSDRGDAASHQLLLHQLHRISATSKRRGKISRESNVVSELEGFALVSKQVEGTTGTERQR